MTDKEELTADNKGNITENEADKDVLKAAALAYAKYLNEHGLEPGAPFDAEEAAEAEEAEEAGAEKDAADVKDKEPEERPAKKKPVSSKKLRAKKKAHEQYKKDFEKYIPRKDPFTAIINFHDKAQDKVDGIASGIGMDFARGAHNIVSTYQHSRRSIGLAIFIIGLLAAVILVVFDRYTVYEYAYNGKQLGYVKDQEEVTDVLDVAGREMSRNTSGEAKVEFVANQNVTFNLVDGRDKSTDDTDTVVNKLIYMSDIETEAYGVYDGSDLKAVVKDQSDAEEVLTQTKAELSTPDSGMTLVSSEFTNSLEIRPIDVLLGSVQSNASALRQMIEGGDMEVYHIVSADDIDISGTNENISEEEAQALKIAKLAEAFDVDTADLFDEEGRDVLTEVEQGDIVCLKISVEPVSVKMVETGRIKEVIEYETIKKDSDEYYQGDTHIEQKGVNGQQIFEGTITKVAGEVTDRDEISTEVIKEKKDKIILIGTKERPKTAATGTFQMPIKTYVVTSEFGGRWGRMHEGMDFGASTGTMIYASDGGTVVRASYYGGYGYCVDIDHENGYLTRYGHCSRLLVSVGDKVYQGQEIALVGSTGHSTGSHLHFEVRDNGTAKNPRNYVNP